MQSIKCVVVGNSTVGKTSLLETFTIGKFPMTRPIITDNISKNVMFDNQTINLNLWDTTEYDFNRSRPLRYPGTDIFMICFSIADPSSLENVKLKWVPEVCHHCPGTKFILVGTKLDLRDDPKIITKLAYMKSNPVTYEQGLAIANYLGAVCYIECSSLTRKGVSCLFTEMIRFLLAPKQKTLETNETNCTAM